MTLSPTQLQEWREAAKKIVRWGRVSDVPWEVYALANDTVPALLDEVERLRGALINLLKLVQENDESWLALQEAPELSDARRALSGGKG